MAVSFVRVVSGMTQEQYDRITREVYAILGGPEKRPEGGILHLAGPTQGGWVIVEAWESQEALERYRREVLAPASERAGLPTPPGPARGTFEVHNILLPVS